MNTDKIYAESIANEYSPKDTSKVVALKKLDRKAKMSSNVFGYTFGAICTLLLGIGMCLVLKVIGSDTPATFAIGIVVGILGIIGCTINYPIFKKLRQKGMDKYANDIILLAKDISDQE